MVQLDKYTTIETLLDFNTNSHARIIADLISEEQWMNICERKGELGKGAFDLRF